MTKSLNISYIFIVSMEQKEDMKQIYGLVMNRDKKALRRYLKEMNKDNICLRNLYLDWDKLAKG